MSPYGTAHGWGQKVTPPFTREKLIGDFFAPILNRTKHAVHVTIIVAKV